MAPIISMGRLRMGENPSRGFALPTPRSYRGRVSSAIPSPGIILPASKGGKAPITYSTSNLPSGLAFNAATRAITGNPTNAHATRAVSYSATDASETITQTFAFPVVASNAALELDDYDNAGYGLSTRTVHFLALLQATVNVAGSNVAIWRRPPQAGSQVGTLLDGGLTLSGGGTSVVIDQITFQVSSDRVEFRENTSLHIGSYVGTTLGAPSMYLRIGSDENEIDYDRGFSAVAQWRRTSPDLGAFLQGFDVGVRMLIAVSSP